MYLINIFYTYVILQYCEHEKKSTRKADSFNPITIVVFVWGQEHCTKI